MAPAKIIENKKHSGLILQTSSQFRRRVQWPKKVIMQSLLTRISRHVRTVNMPSHLQHVYTAVHAMTLATITLQPEIRI